MKRFSEQIFNDIEISNQKQTFPSLQQISATKTISLSSSVCLSISAGDVQTRYFI